MNAIDTTYSAGTSDAFALKLNPAGTALVYSTYLGGTATDDGTGIVVDSTGAAYITGTTQSKIGFPLKNANKSAPNFWYRSSFLSKLTPGGDALVFSTYVGGTYDEWAMAVYLDTLGNVYVTGQARSLDFPLSNGLYPATPDGALYVVKFNATGTMLYSTLTPSTTMALTVDTAGALYTATTGAGALTLSKLSATDASVVWTKNIAVDLTRTFEVHRLAATDTGALYVAGITGWDGLPMVNAFDTFNDFANIFLMRISADGATIEDSTYIGRGGFFRTYGIATDPTGGVWLAGSVNGGLPVTAIDVAPDGVSDAFVLKMKGAVTTVPITLTTSPPGLQVAADRVGGAAPRVYNWVPGSTHLLSTPDSQYLGGTVYNFLSWSENVPNFGTITAPARPVTITATFRATVCSYTVAPTTFTLGKAAQSFSMTITATPGCPWTTANTVPWISPYLSDGYTYATFNVDATTVARTGTFTVAGTTITVNQTLANQTPDITRGTPSAAFSTPQPFTLIASDADGATDIDRIYFVVNDSATVAPNTCHGFLERATNHLFLYNDNLGTLLGPITMGGSEFLQNSQCTLYGHLSEVTASTGSMLLVNLELALRGSFASRSLKLFALTADLAGQNSGWSQISTWTLMSPPVNLPPQVRTPVTPAPTGSPQVFAFAARDVDGAADISRLYFLVGTSRTATAGTCYGYYERAGNALYLYNDAGNAVTGPLAPGAAGLLENSQCVLFGATTAVASAAGVDLRINVGLGLKAPYAYTTKDVYLMAVDSAGGNSGWTTLTSWLPGSAFQPPMVLNGSPASPVGSPQTFTVQLRDADGYTNLSRIYFVANATATVALNTCHGFFDRATNAFYLYDDTLTVLRGPLAAGGAGFIENSQCRLDGTGSAVVAATGTDLSLGLTLSLKSPYSTSPRKLYFLAADAQAMDSGWVQISTWTNGVAPQPPSILSGVIPALTGPAQSISMTARDPNGAANIQRIYFVVNNSPFVAPNGCHGFYDRVTNAFFLYNDALTIAQGPLTPGAAGKLQNSNCEIDGPATAAPVLAGNDMTITPRLTLKGSLASTGQMVYAIATDMENAASPWTPLVSWTAATQANRPPSVIVPASGNWPSGPQGLPIAARDLDGASDIGRIYFLIDASTNITAVTCHGFYDRAANAFFLYADGLSPLLGPLAPGSAGTLQNSQCALSGATTALVSATGTDLVLNLAANLKGTFATQAKTVYLWATDNAGNNTGWTQIGTWAPPAGNRTPAIVSATPAAPTAATESFNLLARDADGFADLQRVYFLLAASPTVGVNGCHGFYDRVADAYFLYNDSLTAYMGPAGVLENSQCRLNGTTGTQVVSASGTDLTLRFGLTRKGAAATGTLNLYLLAADSAGANSGWVQAANWSVSGVTPPPSVISATPAAVTGRSQLLTVTARDANGASNIGRVYFQIAGSTAISGPVCHGFFDRAANAYFLWDDALTTITGPLTAGAAGTLSNSQCAISGPLTQSATSTGTDLTIRPHFTLQGALATGPQKVYFLVTDLAQRNTGWVQGGTWTP